MEQRDLNYGEDSSPSGQGLPVRRGRFRILPIVVFAIFALFYYFGNQQTVPITGRKQLVDMSRQDEMALGLQSYQEIISQSTVVRGGREAVEITDVGRKIARVIDDSDYQWEFNLIDSAEINAFCLPGGKVAVYTGILPVAEDSDGLAVVMGHEIAHALARHGAERIAHERLAQFGQLALGAAVGEMDRGQQRAIMGAFGLGAQYGVLLPFSRSHESEADHMGLILMARACFDPTKAPAFWERMNSVKQGGSPPEFASTHPSDARRIEQLKEWLPEALAERAKYCGQ